MWSAGASREAMLFAGLRSFILVTSGALLVKHGASGLALAMLITYIIQTAYLVPYVKHKTARYFADAGCPELGEAKSLFAGARK
jgi:hypothetical protein